jgi:hypothetical protein
MIKNNIIKFLSFFKSKIFLFFLFGILLVYFVLIYSSDLDSKYKDIELQSAIDNTKVKDNLKFKFIHGRAYLSLENGEKISINGSMNENYSPQVIDEFIETGDYLFKRKDSDTVFIKRRNNGYYFIIGKTINR